MGRSPEIEAAFRPLRAGELQVLRSQYEKEGMYAGVQTKFNYAWGLICEDQRSDQQEGLRLLAEIFRAAPERQRECLWYMALANYKLGNYGESRRLNDALLEHEGKDEQGKWKNRQASKLEDAINEKVTREGLMGIAIMGGLAVAAGTVASLVFKGVRRR
ncbi:Mitochondrial membrane fission protein [Penicillium cosmopolitanum]|uniref:Mitochondrial fission 1 protein n=1 Tax=Penicillium cosmopolitanum TaxID=1131564 RepID=A0A9W9VQL7_9EURO|nr:Mitochondrial membrane fission protein [Penicillium cosmopolitanum]XP_057123285.1 Mitochondrial membrane fission protein [Penicillium waksmanii]KAJ5387527.1 Mitochondrial membrane fission protein [Penicillium cosmopolitanum]KAJ5984247.1 Mitochondrial membrane fission protein [Penicillium waksmanii]